MVDWMPFGSTLEEIGHAVGAGASGLAAAGSRAEEFAEEKYRQYSPAALNLAENVGHDFVQGSQELEHKVVDAAQETGHSMAGDLKGIDPTSSLSVGWGVLKMGGNLAKLAATTVFDTVGSAADLLDHELDRPNTAIAEREYEAAIAAAPSEKIRSSKAFESLAVAAQGTAWLISTGSSITALAAFASETIAGLGTIAVGAATAGSFGTALGPAVASIGPLIVQAQVISDGADIAFAKFSAEQAVAAAEAATILAQLSMSGKAPKADAVAEFKQANSAATNSVMAFGGLLKGAEEAVRLDRAVEEMESVEPKAEKVRIAIAYLNKPESPDHDVTKMGTLGRSFSVVKTSFSKTASFVGWVSDATDHFGDVVAGIAATRKFISGLHGSAEEYVDKAESWSSQKLRSAESWVEQKAADVSGLQIGAGSSPPNARPSPSASFPTGPSNGSEGTALQKSPQPGRSVNSDAGLESEADRMGARALAKSPSGARPSSTGPRRPPGGTRTGDPNRLLKSLLKREGPGFGLPSQLASELGRKMGSPIGHARIHTGPEAAKTAAALGAEAFTIGSDVFFAQGKYDAASPSGLGLVAHELWHVVQQSGPPTGDMSSATGLLQLEREAHSMGQEVLSHFAGGGTVEIEHFELNAGYGASSPPREISARIEAIGRSALEAAKTHLSLMQLPSVNLDSVDVNVSLDIAHQSEAECIDHLTFEIVRAVQATIERRGATAQAPTISSSSGGQGGDGPIQRATNQQLDAAPDADWQAIDDEEGGYEYTRYNPGPMTEGSNLTFAEGRRAQEEAAAAFRGGRYNKIVLEEPTYLYRAGPEGERLKRWYTRTAPMSELQARDLSGVPQQWIDPETGKLTGYSPMDTVHKVLAPKGTVIYEGPAGYQNPGAIGGGEQIFIPDPDGAGLVEIPGAAKPPPGFGENRYLIDSPKGEAAGPTANDIMTKGAKVPEALEQAGSRLMANEGWVGDLKGVFRFGGKVVLVIAVAADVYQIVEAQDHVKATLVSASGWAGASAGAAAFGLMFAPADVAGPLAWAAHGTGTLVAGGIGYWIGSSTTRYVYELVVTKPPVNIRAK
jgi:hypothetical protein